MREALQASQSSWGGRTLLLKVQDLRTCSHQELGHWEQSVFGYPTNNAWERRISRRSNMAPLLSWTSQDLGSCKLSYRKEKQCNP